MGLYRPLRLVKRARRREGASAVEFALVATPFFVLLFGILEIGFIFLLDSMLSNSAAEASRLIRTGQAEAQGFTAATFKRRVCERMSLFSAGCDSRLSIDVRVIPRFTNPNPPNPLEGGAFSESGLLYDGGDAGDIILVRAWYRHGLIMPVLNQALSRMHDGTVILTTTLAFRNEPWN